ncbi:hypothetical protein FN976_00180 [Caenimonas sedimenti]|uniref:DUF2489 domain-containing protein n=1 Tax=Caenimonas sedimenti TaxID=2596921 RepID=A0A562ZXV2_9BURK|nr:hypothetical protein [Caenimonas sedimenti]TWO73303.1 hypothetical protein FN976_00180 [Caenimonas sedimenti]
MQATIYYTAWMVALLAAVAVLSVAITRHKRRIDRRRQQAIRMLRALTLYGDWVSAQRLVALPQGTNPAAEAALVEASALGGDAFPELAGEMAGLLAMHEKLVAFLRAQQLLWRHDPGNWLKSDHDRQFMALWRLHRAALQVLEEKLQAVVAVRHRGTAGRRQSTYA